MAGIRLRLTVLTATLGLVSSLAAVAFAADEYLKLKFVGHSSYNCDVASCSNFTVSVDNVQRLGGVGFLSEKANSRVPAHKMAGTGGWQCDYPATGQEVSVVLKCGGGCDATDDADVTLLSAAESQQGNYCYARSVVTVTGDGRTPNVGSGTAADPYEKTVNWNIEAPKSVPGSSPATRAGLWGGLLLLASAVLVQRQRVAFRR